MAGHRTSRPRTAVKSHLAALFRELGVLVWTGLLRTGRDLRDAAARGPRELGRRAGVLALRIGGYVAATALAFVLVASLVAAHWPGWFARSTLVVLILFVAPLALGRLPLLRERRGVATAWSVLLILALLVFGGRDLGGAVRRHGDWFLRQRTDVTAAWMRSAIGGTGALLEWFVPPAQMHSHELPPEATPQFYGPWHDGESPYPAEPVIVRWFHPLAANAERNLPAFESRRFGAVRPQPRPWECELGHCGVDLAAPLGEPVLAVADGVVERVERDAAAGGRAGRFVRLAHCDGTVVTRYIHLNGIRKDLHPGRHVAAGEPLGTVGRTGVDENFPHLHFGMSLRAPDGRERYVDPEPFLRLWELRPTLPTRALPPAMIALR